MRMLILSTGTPSRHLVEALKGHQFERHNPGDLYLYVSESVNGYDRIYNGKADLSTPERLHVRGFDAVISRIGSNLTFGATILQHITENLGIYCPQSAHGLLLAQDKMKTVMRLSAESIRAPLTVFAQKASHVDFIMKKLGDLPVIAKVLKGSQGMGVMICKDKEQTNTTLESFWGHDIDIMLQRYIDTGSKDVRAIVVGDKVVVAMERTGSKDFRANISQGGSGTKITLTADQEKMCVQSAKVLGLEFAGVDIMTDKEGRSYVIEVNGNPGTKIIDITSHNYFVDLVKHIESRVKSGQAAKNASDDKPTQSSSIDKEIFLGDSKNLSQLQILQSKEAKGILTYNERAMLMFLKSRQAV